MKTFYIKTFGCQMNVYDGQRIVSMLRDRGMTATDDVALADIIILNTCAVREKATNKVFSELGRIRDRKKPGALFGIVGCVAREAGADANEQVRHNVDGHLPGSDPFQRQIVAFHEFHGVLRELADLLLLFRADFGHWE